jgi:hypothetical protein
VEEGVQGGLLRGAAALHLFLRFLAGALPELLSFVLRSAQFFLGQTSAAAFAVYLNSGRLISGFLHNAFRLALQIAYHRDQFRVHADSPVSRSLRYG